MHPWLCIWKLVCRWSEVWQLAVNFSNDNDQCQVSKARLCSCPFLRGMGHTGMANDMGHVGMAGSCHGIGPGTWDSGFKGASRKEKMEIRQLGEGALCWWQDDCWHCEGRRRHWDRRRNKMLETGWMKASCWMVLLYRFLYWSYTCTCVHCYTVLNCRSANHFCHLFPRVSSAQRVNLGCAIKAAAPCQSPSFFVLNNVEGQRIVGKDGFRDLVTWFWFVTYKSILLILNFYFFFKFI